MMLIPCPWCGPRDEAEFRCGGESHIVRPDPDRADDDAWAAYLFDRTNLRGPGSERWLHRHGCGRWFNLVRDTVTHEIHGAYAMTDPRPEPDP